MEYVEGLAARLKEVDAEMERLRIKRDLLAELLKEQQEGDPFLYEFAGNMTPSPDFQPPEPMGATAAILAFIRRHPGSTGRDIVDAVEGNVRMDAKDPRRNLFSIVSTLKRRGRLRKDAGGRFYIAS